MIGSRVFISHSFRDRGPVASMVEMLRLAGVPFYFCREEIPQDRDFEDLELRRLLLDGISSSDAMIIVVDDSSLDSRWVTFELEAACEVRKKRTDFKIIPLIFDTPRTALPPYLADEDPVDLSAGVRPTLAKILSRISGTNVTWSALFAKIAQNTGEFCEGKSLYEHLDDLEAPEQTAAIIKHLRGLFLPRRRFAEIDMITLPNRISVEQYMSMGISKFVSDPFPFGELWGGLELGVSCLPTPALPGVSTRRYAPADEWLDAGLFSLWPPHADPTPQNMLTFCFNFQDRVPWYIILAWRNQLHRYTFGSEVVDPHLLTERFQMGSSAWFFVAPFDIR